MQTVRSRDKNSRYAHSNGAFPRDERILFNDIKTYLKCKLQGQLQMAVLKCFGEQTLAKILHSGEMLLFSEAHY